VPLPAATLAPPASAVPRNRMTGRRAMSGGRQKLVGVLR
jgi:hypothetical protein